MAKNDVQSWDQTAANNTDIAGINIAEFCPPSSLNDAIRTLMAQIAAWLVAAAGPLLKSGGAMTGAITGMGNASTISDGQTSPTNRALGYRSLYTARSVSAAAIIALTDEGLVIKSTTGGLTVPNNSTVACPVDFLTCFYNNSGSSQTIALAASVTMRLEGAASTQSTVTVPAYTRAFLWQTAANTWLASGKGLT